MTCGKLEPNYKNVYQHLAGAGAEGKGVSGISLSCPKSNFEQRLSVLAPLPLPVPHPHPCPHPFCRLSFLFAMQMRECVGGCHFVCGCVCRTMSFLLFGPDFVALCGQIFGMTLHLQ